MFPNPFFKRPDTARYTTLRCPFTIHESKKKNLSKTAQITSLYSPNVKVYTFPLKKKENRPHLWQIWDSQLRVPKPLPVPCSCGMLNGSEASETVDMAEVWSGFLPLGEAILESWNQGAESRLIFPKLKFHGCQDLNPKVQRWKRLWSVAGAKPSSQTKTWRSTPTPWLKDSSILIIPSPLFCFPSFPHQKPSSHIPFFVTHGIFVALSFEMNLFQTLTVKLKLLGHHGFSRTGTKRSHLQNSRLRNLPSQTLRSRRRLKVRLFLGTGFNFPISPDITTTLSSCIVFGTKEWLFATAAKGDNACSTGGTSAGLGDAWGSWLSMEIWKSHWKAWCPGRKEYGSWIWKNDT